MNNNGWITDRLPTKEEAPYGRVLLSGSDRVWEIETDLLAIGDPWMPFPDPYVKPKRWSVDWNEYCNCYVITDGEQRIQLHFNQCKDAAQRICDIYNEVMP